MQPGTKVPSGIQAAAQLAPLWLRLPLVQFMVTEPVVPVLSVTAVEPPCERAGVEPLHEFAPCVQVSERAPQPAHAATEQLAKVPLPESVPLVHVRVLPAGQELPHATELVLYAVTLVPCGVDPPHGSVQEAHAELLHEA